MLDHFARHHLNAARDAHARARRALDADDEEAFVYWADICHALDRRLAATLSRPRTRPS